MIKLDFTQISVVVTCSLCPWWHGFGFDRSDAWKAGARHEKTMHPECEQARDAARKSN